MNTYRIKFTNRIRVDRSVEFVLTAPSRNEAVKRGEELLAQAGYKLAHFQRPTITERTAA